MKTMLALVASILIDCTAAIRVGAFWMIRRVLRDGLSIDAALEEAHKVGLTGRRTRDEIHLWANTFDRPSFDLDVQGELAERIAQSVAAQLTAR